MRPPHEGIPHQECLRSPKATGNQLCCIAMCADRLCVCVCFFFFWCAYHVKNNRIVAQLLQAKTHVDRVSVLHRDNHMFIASHLIRESELVVGIIAAPLAALSGQVLPEMDRHTIRWIALILCRLNRLKDDQLSQRLHGSIVLR